MNKKSQPEEVKSKAKNKKVMGMPLGSRGSQGGHYNRGRGGQGGKRTWRVPPYCFTCGENVGHISREFKF